jgi:hypothetical protein
MNLHATLEGGIGLSVLSQKLSQHTFLAVGCLPRFSPSISQCDVGLEFHTSASMGASVVICSAMADSV